MEIVSEHEFVGSSPCSLLDYCRGRFVAGDPENVSSSVLVDYRGMFYVHVDC